MSPVVILILLLGLGGSRKNDGGGPSDGEGGDGEGVGYDPSEDETCPPFTAYRTGIANINSFGVRVPLDTEGQLYGLTLAELNAFRFIAQAMNKATGDNADNTKLGWVTPWEGVCGPQSVANRAGVELDEYGALAVATYWFATKSAQPRPWPENDLDVLGRPDVYPYGGGIAKIPLAQYLVERIKHYKATWLKLTK